MFTSARLVSFGSFGSFVSVASFARVFALGACSVFGLMACGSDPGPTDESEDVASDSAEARTRRCRQDADCRKGFACDKQRPRDRWGRCVKASCVVDNTTYLVGETFPSTDGCNTCTCMAPGAVACTEMACASSCDYNGSTYHEGDSFPSTDGCNTCTCGAGGLVGCTKMACAPTCDYNGNTYHEGDSFPSTDGCNTCTCGTGGVVGCTKRACACNPVTERNRSYVGHSPDECMRIRFACVAGTNYFSNACGCGCEQPADCPAWVNCMPGPGPSTCAAERARCPFSPVAF